MQTFSTLSLQTLDATLLIQLNRPDKLNALNGTMLEELEAIFADRQLIASHRSIVITGVGKAFAAGADIAELSECTEASGEAFSRRGQRVFQLIETCPIPVVAAINGYALGGGCELALACHLRFASTKAVFGQPEVKLGIIPGYGATQRLVRLVGIAHALELMLTGEHISAERALAIGLVNRLVDAASLLDDTVAFCTKIAQLPRRAIESIIHCAYSASPLSFDTEARQFATLCGTEDFREGTRAFLEKRTPNFRGQ